MPGGYTPSVYANTIQLSEAEQAWLQAHPHIRLGIDPEFVPFEFIDDDGNYSGIASDYIKLLNKRLGTHLEVIHRSGWKEAVDMAKRRQLDVLPCVGITEERKRYFLFSRPYLQFYRVVVTRHDVSFIKSIDDLEGMSVVVEANSSHEGYLRDHSSIRAEHRNSQQQALLAVANGEADAFVGNLASSVYWMQKMNLSNLKVAGSLTTHPGELHFAVRKDWPLLVSILNKGLASVTHEERKRIAERWLSLKYETIIDYSLLWKVSVAFMFLVLLVLAWNYQIHRQRQLAQAARDEAEAARLKLEHLNQQMLQAQQELEAANAHLKQLDRLKSMFIASVSHELRTPLNSIIGFSGLLLQGISGEINEEQRDDLRRIYHSGKHLLDLITDIIDISKIEAGRVDIFPGEFSLHALINEAARLIGPQAQEKGLQLTLDTGSDIDMYTDRKRLLQVLLNLMSNAVKYSETGVITVDARLAGDDMVDIAVWDTGIGIAKEDLPRLFEAFERLDSHLRVRAGGTGLGLYLTRKIVVDILGGNVSVQSKEGEGSVFGIHIPRRIDAKRVDNP